MRSFFCAGLGAITLAIASARGMFLQPELEPLDRLVKNAETYLAAHANDPAAHYTLARIHYLAFALRINLVPCFPPNAEGIREPAPDHLVGLPAEMGRRNRAIELARKELGVKGDLPSEPEKMQQFWQTVTRITEKLTAENWTPPPLSSDALLNHADRAAQLFKRAMELDGRNGLYPLGYGSLLMQVADWVETSKIATLPDSLKLDHRASARASFLKAWNLAYTGEGQAKSLPPSGLPGLVSHEAGRGFLQLCDSERATLTAEEKAALPKVRAGLEKLEKLPQLVVTPIALSLTSAARLADLLQPESAVEFDLAGLGQPERWQWIKPELGLLVWDPLDHRKIESGRQLFGHFTFRIFRENGYRALAALDDDGNSRLTGWELVGLSVWFDGNGDGVSTKDEVTPLHEIGVQAIECQATSSDDRQPMNPLGVTFHDGRVLPTWDWIPQRAPALP